MTSYKNHIRFFIVFFLFTVIVVTVRLHWIHKALPSRATVLYIDHTRFARFRQYYPVVSYQTHNGEVVTRGTYNLPIETGQTVDILYNPDDTQKFRLNTSYWLWYDIWSWYRVVLVVIAMYYLMLFIVKRNLNQKTPGKVVFETRQGNDLENTKSDTISYDTSEKGLAPQAKHVRRLPRLIKVILLLLLPVTVFLIGQIWGVPYARQIGVVIFLAYVALAPLSSSSTNGDI